MADPGRGPDIDSGTVRVHVAEALALLPKGGAPLCKVFYGKQKAQTQACKESLTEPTWNEQFNFKIHRNNVLGELMAIVWSKKGHFLGQVNVTLDGGQLQDGRLYDLLLPLHKRSPKSQVTGKLRLRLGYSLHKDGKQPQPQQATPQFAVGLDALMRTRPDSTLPVVVEECFRFLTIHGTKEEGIFRVPGNHDKILHLRKLYESGEVVSLDEYDVHTVAGLVKLWFRELPEPFIPRALNDMAASAVEADDASVTQEMAFFVKSLSVHAQELLRHLALLLRQIDEEKETTKMPFDNLLTCLVPTLRVHPSIISFAARNYDLLFLAPLDEVAADNPACVAADNENRKRSSSGRTRGRQFVTQHEARRSTEAGTSAPAGTDESNPSPIKVDDCEQHQEHQEPQQEPQHDSGHDDQERANETVSTDDSTESIASKAPLENIAATGPEESV